MKALDTRKAIADLRHMCKARGIEVSVDTSGGKGSHQGLLFHDPKTNEYVRLVIPGHKELSPGVQRKTLETMGRLAIRVGLATVIREILRHIF
jgi:hypothetical protein